MSAPAGECTMAPVFFQSWRRRLPSTWLCIVFGLWCLLSDKRGETSRHASRHSVEIVRLTDATAKRQANTGRIISSKDCYVTIKNTGRGNFFVRVQKSNSDLDVELEDNLEDDKYIKTLKYYLNELNQENFDFVFYIAGVDIHFNDRLGKLKISDEGIKLRDELVVENFFSRRIPFCGVLGGGYNKDFNKLVELHSMLHQSCAKYIGS